MGLTPPIVAFSLLGDISLNSRALRQIDALTQSGFSVAAFGFCKTKERSISIPNGQIHLLAYPESRGPELFLKAHTLLSNGLKSVNADVFHASDLYSLPASARAANQSRSYLTYDSRELYTHVESLRKNPVKRSVWSAIEKRYIRKCDRIFTVSDQIANHLQNVYAVNLPLTIYNTPDLSSQKPSFTDIRNHIHDSGDLLVVHNGQVRTGRGCLALASSIRFTKNVSLVFLGDGPLKNKILENAVIEGSDKKIVFVDPVPPDEVISATSRASIGATVLEDSCLNHRYALPNKLFEYASASVPILASDLPEIATMVDRFNVGTLVNPDNPQSIAAKLNEIEQNRDLLKMWKANTRNLVETFNWQSASEAFSNAFLSLLDS